jgi:hypothetical protein
MNNNLFDVALAIEQSLKLLSKSTDNHKLLKRFADEADSFQQYLVKKKDIFAAYLREAEELRDRAVEIGDEGLIMETNDMRDQYFVDLFETDRAFFWNQGEIIKINARLCASEQSVKHWNDNLKQVLVSVAEHLQRSRQKKAICCGCGDKICNERIIQCTACGAVGCGCCVQELSCVSCGVVGCYKCIGFEECEECSISIYCFECGGASYCPECEQCLCQSCIESHNSFGEMTCGSCLDRMNIEDITE